jgi:hypothetical protein
MGVVRVEVGLMYWVLPVFFICLLSYYYRGVQGCETTGFFYMIVILLSGRSRV